MELLSLFIETSPIFLRGMLLTFQLTIVSILIAIFIGLFFAFLKISTVKILEWIANLYIFLVRGTPLVVQIFIFYFGLTALNISQFWSVVLGLAFHNGAYIAEIFRGAIQSVDKGQMGEPVSWDVKWIIDAKNHLATGVSEGVTTIGKSIYYCFKGFFPRIVYWHV